jgi:hypothetical protein
MIHAAAAAAASASAGTSRAMATGFDGIEGARREDEESDEDPTRVSPASVNEWSSDAVRGAC